MIPAIFFNFKSIYSFYLKYFVLKLIIIIYFEPGTLESLNQSLLSVVIIISVSTEFRGIFASRNSIYKIWNDGNS